MKVIRLLQFIFILTIILVIESRDARAQNGDQILDGIGETGLVARYLFNGNLSDWSRNKLHASLKNDTGGANLPRFTDDNRFGKVLSLQGNIKSSINIPPEALADLESMTITAWIKLRSDKRGQVLFEIGNSNGNRLLVTPTGIAAKSGYLVQLGKENGKKVEAVTSVIDNNKWVHLAIVIDIASKSITTYVDSKQVAQTKNITTENAAVFTGTTGNKILIGGSVTPMDSTLNAMLYDFRIYRVPLSNTQLAGIYRNAQRGLNNVSVNTTAKREDTLPYFSKTHPQLYMAYLLEVPDIKVETATGNFPRLPAHLPGKYKDGLKGPKARVIWPASIDNNDFLKPGSYTITGRIAGTDFHPKALVTIKPGKESPAPVAKLEKFPLNQVSLQNNQQGIHTRFIDNRDKFLKTLATTDPNSFLYMFRDAFGQPQPTGAVPLGAWDSRDTKLRGHATGHYLSAIAQAYAGTGYDQALQASFAGKMDYLVNTLYTLSQLSGKPKQSGGRFTSEADRVPVGEGKTDYDSDLSEQGIRNDYWNWGTGFISAYPPDQFIMLEKGAKYGGQKTQIWAPYYTLHKILAGLMDVYEVSGNKKALDIASGMGDWVYARLSKVPTDTLIKMWNTYIAGEFGGMNEAMARLYRLNGKPTHLKTAQLFDNIRVFFGDTAHSHGLAKNVDLFRGLHANQHIPQVIGSIETYRATNNPEYYKIADNFWYKAVNDYMYSIGGVAGARNPANAECFISEPGMLYENGFSSGGQNETCATYNMLKLTGDLFMFDQKAEYMDYYERALYNHILASVDEKTPANTYHVPLRPGSVKQFGNPNMTGFTCCNGTAIESSTKLQNSIYFKSKDNNSLYVNLYIPSRLDWKERAVQIEQATDYPNEDATRLTVRGSGNFNIYVRVPGWATNGFTMSINGKAEKASPKPGTYYKLSRAWKDGDVIEIKMPFGFHLDPVPDQQNIASLFYGPILLAAQEPEARKTWRKVTLDAENIGKSVTGDRHQLHFKIDDTELKPFFETYGRHSVYMDVKLK